MAASNDRSPAEREQRGRKQHPPIRPRKLSETDVTIQFGEDIRPLFRNQQRRQERQEGGDRGEVKMERIPTSAAQSRNAAESGPRNAPVAQPLKPERAPAVLFVHLKLRSVRLGAPARARASFVDQPDDAADSFERLCQKHR